MPNSVFDCSPSSKRQKTIWLRYTATATAEIAHVLPEILQNDLVICVVLLARGIEGIVVNAGALAVVAVSFYNLVYDLWSKSNAL
jgi:hypothetical protein